MKHPLVWILLSAAIGGVTAALVTAVALDDGGRAAPAAVRGATPTASAGDGDARLLELERRDAELELRLKALESAAAQARAPAASSPAGGADQPVPGAELELARRTFAGEEPVPAVFVARVQEALDEIRAAEERDREAQRLQARDERIEARLRRLDEELGLSSYQVDELRVVLQAQETRRAELFDGLREGGDPFTLREGMRELAETTDASLSAILSPVQLEGYRESADAFGFGLRWRDGGAAEGDEGARMPPGPSRRVLRRGDGR